MSPWHSSWVWQTDHVRPDTCRTSPEGVGREHILAPGGLVIGTERPKVIGRLVSQVSDLSAAHQNCDRRAAAGLDRLINMGWFQSSYTRLCIALLTFACIGSAKEVSPVTDQSKSIYGGMNPHAPAELRVFSFLIGKWSGTGKTKLQDGTVAEFPVT
jgi:hypothetical protein